MKTLIAQGELIVSAEQGDTKETRLRLLKRLGFKEAVENFRGNSKLDIPKNVSILKITREQIVGFLTRKLEGEFYKRLPKSKWPTREMLPWVFSRKPSIREGWISGEDCIYCYIGCFFQIKNWAKMDWIEYPVQSYRYEPPMSVLRKLQKVKRAKIFDFYTIASARAGDFVLPDPLLFGRFKDNTDRYLIAQWGDDLKADDIV